ncbi:hypothetical protein OJAV_G00095630 [Oryzias javanicus]|uniref:LRAT domain-containing protein n=1 Tax=Oryzias javanicus TaxID=123683 RepID=A0A437D1C3_ORYJA|nr:hypothetical protein OJAV_G00095630 [Oryzias javanicus]
MITKCLRNAGPFRSCGLYLSAGNPSVKKLQFSPLPRTGTLGNRKLRADSEEKRSCSRTNSVFIRLNMSFFSPSRVSASRKNTDKASGKEVEPGDLIEIFRGNYNHWAVYIGNGYVVHFGAPNALSGSSNMTGDGIVMKEKLQDVVGKDKWRVKQHLG